MTEETKNPVGRPLKFPTPEILNKKIREYFVSCWSQKLDMFGNPIFKKDANGKKTDQPVLTQHRPYTITGLALALGTSREVLLNYKERDEYTDSIKKALETCHNFAEEQLYVGKNPAGVIFNLKNNYKWKDESKIETDGHLFIINRPK
jgi:hypothetical protein